MFEQIFNFIIRASNVAPKYNPDHCLVVSRAIGGCTLCQDVCPHEAIDIKRQVEIDEIDCTGCGLCVQICPSQAIEAKLSYQAASVLKCSKVSGSAQSVLCLGRLQVSDLVRLSSRRDKISLVRQECKACSIGNAEVAEAIDRLIPKAQTLAKTLDKDLSIDVIVAEHYDATDNPERLSRRELLRGGFKHLQVGTSDVLAPLEALMEKEDDKSSLPSELVKQYKIIELSQPEPEDLVPWQLPTVREGCIMCPVCTNVCPTDAFSREFSKPSEKPRETGDSLLRLEPHRCNGCNACVTSCPIKVIDLKDEVTWAELSGGSEVLYRKSPQNNSKEDRISR
ncbi:MAG: 4Fe-4S dicluster domain-containing protein [Deinococcales bacterium]